MKVTKKNINIYIGNVGATARLFLLVAFVSLLSCQSDDKLTGVAAGASGRYIVTAYIVSGDTLFSLLSGTAGYKPSINKIGVGNFTIDIEVKESDQLDIRTSYWRNGIRSTFSKGVSVRLTNYDYQFSLIKSYPSFTYEGSVGRLSGFFYERTVGGGVLIPQTDSTANSNQSTSQNIVIVAQLTK